MNAPSTSNLVKIKQAQVVVSQTKNYSNPDGSLDIVVKTLTVETFMTEGQSRNKLRLFTPLKQPHLSRILEGSDEEAFKKGIEAFLSRSGSPFESNEDSQFDNIDISVTYVDSGVDFEVTADKVEEALLSRKPMVQISQSTTIEIEQSKIL